MALRLLIDVGVGYLVEEWLRDNSFDIVAVRDLDCTMPDDVILEKAVADNRLVVTMDKDFGELVFQSGKLHAGVLLLRLETETSAEKIAVISRILSSFSEEIEGHFCVYQRGRLRIRKGRP
jgi:predicted nuclease of predicted toxin-antitoxin system